MSGAEAMFELGRSYKITTGLGNDEGYSTYVVVAYEAPWLKATGAGRETIFNTSSPTFVSAEKELTQEEEEARWTDMPDYLKPRAAPSR